MMAHPNLTGKQTADGCRPPESSPELAEAGLDVLADAAQAMFTTLNETYMAAFRFPFITALSDKTKASIKEEFRRRAANDRAIEFEQACRQVERITLLGLQQKFAK